MRALGWLLTPVFFAMSFAASSASARLHSYLHFPKRTRTEAIETLLREINRDRFADQLIIEGTRAGEDRDVYGQWRVALGEKNGKNAFELCLNRPKRAAERGARVEVLPEAGAWAGWVSTVFLEELSARGRVAISDDTAAPRRKGSPDVYPTFLSFLRELDPAGRSVRALKRFYAHFADERAQALDRLLETRCEDLLAR